MSQLSMVPVVSLTKLAIFCCDECLFVTEKQHILKGHQWLHHDSQGIEPSEMIEDKCSNQTPSEDFLNQHLEEERTPIRIILRSLKSILHPKSLPKNVPADKEGTLTIERCPFQSETKMQLKRLKSDHTSPTTEEHNGASPAISSRHAKREQTRALIRSMIRDSSSEEDEFQDFKFGSRKSPRKVESSSKNKSPVDEKKEDETFNCVLCSHKCHNKDDLKTHLEKLHVKTISDFQCCVCSLCFAKKIVLLLHLRTVHSMDQLTAKALVEEQLSEQVESAEINQVPADIDLTHNNDWTEDNDWMPDIEDGEQDQEEDTLRRTRNIENLKSKIENLEISDNVVCEDFVPESVSRKKRKNKSGSNETWACKFCQLKFQEIPGLVEHVRESHPGQSCCSTCGTFLSSIGSLRRHVRKFHNNIKEDLKKALKRKKRCLLCDAEFNLAQGLLNHLDKDHPEQALSNDGTTMSSFCCTICENLAMDNLNMLQAHMRASHGIYCDICDKDLTSASSLESHKRNKHGFAAIYDPNMGISKWKLNAKARNKICYICDASLTGILTFRYHMINTHQIKNPELPCSLCPEKFLNIRDYSGHMRKVHNLKKLKKRSPTSCPVCGETFARKESVILHMKKRHDPSEYQDYPLQAKRAGLHLLQGDLKCNTKISPLLNSAVASFVKDEIVEKDPFGQYLCPVCGLKTNKRTLLMQHLSSIHTAEESSICDVCKKIFRNRKVLHRHKRISHPLTEKDASVCHLCGKTLTNSAALRKHLKSVHVKNYRCTCETCGYKCAMPSQLKTHIDMVHLGMRKYACNLCDYTAKKANEVKYHKMREHGLEKPHTCQICNEKFQETSHLKTHIKRIHLKVRVKCPECDKDFSDEYGLKLHMKATHQKKVHKCPECERQFGFPGSMIRHLKSVHGIIPEPSRMCPLKSKNSIGESCTGKGKKRKGFPEIAETYSCSSFLGPKEEPASSMSLFEPKT